MAEHRLEKVVHYLRKLAGGPSYARASDQDLICHFLEFQDKLAFETLVRRHGPMVRDVCARLLKHDADADDAFQAVFLVLVRKARSIRKRQSLASWLYGVAYRIAEKARRDASRRTQREKRLPPPPVSSDPTKEADWRELCRVLDRELNRLSENHKAPLVLCYLQSRTRDEAAKELGLSLRTLDRRLEQGRELMRRRMARLGYGLPVAMCVMGLTQSQASAAISPLLVASTAKAAIIVSAKSASGIGSVSATALALADGLLKSMAAAQIKTGVAVLLFGLTLAGAGTVAFQHAVGHESGTIADGSKLKPIQQQRNVIPGARNLVPTIALRVEQALDKVHNLAATVKNEQKVKLLVDMAKVQMKGGDSKAAAKTLQDAVATAEAIDDQRSQYSAWMSIANAEVLRGDVPAALQLVDKVQAKLPKAQLLVEIARAQAEAGDFGGALKTAESIESWPKGNALSSIATVQAKTGDIAGAVRTADLLHNQSLSRGRALEEIALAQAKAGKRDEAKETLEEARRLILSVIVPQGKADVLARFAIYQAESGDIGGGLETLDALKLDEDKTYKGSKVYIYWRFAAGQVKAGNSDAAIQFAEGLKEAGERISALVAIARAQAEQGEEETARATLAKAREHIEDLSDDASKQQHLAFLAEVLACAGDISLALKTVAHVQEGMRQSFQLIVIAKIQLDRDDWSGALATLRQAANVIPVAEKGDRANPTREYVLRHLCSGLAFLEAEQEARALAAAEPDVFMQALGWIGVAEGLANRQAAKAK